MDFMADPGGYAVEVRDSLGNGASNIFTVDHSPAGSSDYLPG